MSDQDKETKKEKEGRRLRILLYILILLLVILIILLVRAKREERGENPDLEALRDRIKVTDTPAPDTAPPETRPPETKPPETTAMPDTAEPDTTEEETFVIPETTADTTPLSPDRSVLLDFTSLRTVNPEICAWLEIPDSRVDYPVLQSPYYDKKYLTTGFDGSYYIGGSLFTEKTYNKSDFSDPVTIIYGHTMRSGNLFGQLQELYSDPASFEAHRELHLYLPGEHRVYRVFAAVPFSPSHILALYHFDDPAMYNFFFHEVSCVRSFIANMDLSCFPSPGDRVLILSTCVTGDNTQRYLVMAVEEP